MVWLKTEIHNPKIWGLVGLGWLGYSLAKKLEMTNLKTWGTHRNSFDFSKNTFPTDYCDVLFLNTPPLLDLSPSEYVNKILISQNSKIIFTSSTSVYGQNTIPVNESSPTQPLTESAKWLCEVENLLLDKFKDQILIIRLGGLIGKSRHPIYHLSGKNNLKGGNDVINLVHLDDLVCIIPLLEKFNVQGIINVVCPFHPIKNIYYNEWAKRLNLLPVTYQDNEDPRKQIESRYLQSIYPQWEVPHLDRI
jgi:nucleoside-diphosphate-sugar epimerase